MNEKLKFPVHLRDALIVLGLAVIMLILGAFYDYDLSLALYVNANGFGRWFGIIFSGIAELPGYTALFIGGFALIISSVKANKTRKIISYIVGILAMIAAFVLSNSTFWNIYEFAETESSKWLIILLGAFLITAIDGLLAVGLAYYMRNKKEKSEQLFRLAVTIITIVAIELALQTIFKYLASRPRPRYIFSVSIDESQSLFKPFYDWQPFYAFKQGVGDNCKSFPSGHTTTAMVTAFALPLFVGFFVDLKQKPALNIALFYLGFLYAVAMGFSRICCGAHFLSDISAGIILATIVGFASIVVIKIIFEKLDTKHFRIEN